MFLARDGSSLYLKRSETGDHAGEWCIPGGKLEGDETAEEAARREVLEETGYEIKDKMVQHCRTVAPVGPAVPAVAAPPPTLVPPGETGAATSPAEEVDFTTFLVRVPEQFEVELDQEHVGFAWSPITQPPQPLHPGCQIAIERLTWDELGVARAIAAGRLTSPQRYENVSLFALRITGTGTSYRKKHDEFVYRRPENYLTDEFLARCSGLPVIMQHPKGATLNSKEFVDRVVGTIMLPYVLGDEVWGIAKIYDDAAVKMMEERKLSTSPAVVFRNPSVNSKLETENGQKLLIEGKPSLLDHLAICEHGVWDKGEGPTGVNSVDTREDSTMAEKEEDKKADAVKSDAMPENLKKEDSSKADAAKADAAKADADGGTTLDKILKCVDGMSTKMDSISSRVDAMEEKGKADSAKADAAKADEDKDKDKDEKKSDAAGEPEKVVADKKADENKDKDEKKEDSVKSDAAKADSTGVTPEVKRMIDDVSRRLPKQLSDEDHAAMTDAQARADSVFQAFGRSAPRPLDGENLNQYRRRLATSLKMHSTSWKGVDLAAVADDVAFGVAENQIYADATHVAHNPTDLPEGTLRPITSRDVTGRQSTTFAGEPRAWMHQFQPSRRRLVGIRNSRDH